MQQREPPDLARAWELIELVQTDLRLLRGIPGACDSVVSRVESHLEELTAVIASLESLPNARSPTLRRDLRAIAMRLIGKAAEKLLEAMCDTYTWPQPRGLRRKIDRAA